MNNTQLSGIAIDFGGTKISGARVTNGIVGEPVFLRTDGNADINTQIEAIFRLLEKLTLGSDDRVGVAVAGRVNHLGEWFALNTETLSQVAAVPLQAILSEKLARKITVENDATAAAIGEAVLGAGKSTKSICYITVSTGVGGGIILDGRPVRSQNGLAGHVGFTTSQYGLDRCGSGRMRTVESIASGRAIASYAEKSGHPNLDGKAVFEAHLDDQEWATKIIKRSANAVAELCANLKAILDIELIILGGSVGLAEGYKDLVVAALKQEPEIFRPKVVYPKLGSHAALVGILADPEKN